MFRIWTVEIHSNKHETLSQCWNSIDSPPGTLFQQYTTMHWVERLVFVGISDTHVVYALVSAAPNAKAAPPGGRRINGDPVEMGCDIWNFRVCILSKHDTLNQCWFKVGPTRITPTWLQHLCNCY